MKEETLLAKLTFFHRTPGYGQGKCDLSFELLEKLRQLKVDFVAIDVDILRHGTKYHELQEEGEISSATPILIAEKDGGPFIHNLRFSSHTLERWLTEHGFLPLEACSSGS